MQGMPRSAWRLGPVPGYSCSPFSTPDVQATAASWPSPTCGPRRPPRHCPCWTCRLRRKHWLTSGRPRPRHSGHCCCAQRHANAQVHPHPYPRPVACPLPTRNRVLSAEPRHVGHLRPGAGTASNATTVTIDQEIGSLATTPGNLQVCPAQTTTYVMRLRRLSHSIGDSYTSIVDLVYRSPMTCATLPGPAAPVNGPPRKPWVDDGWIMGSGIARPNPGGVIGLRLKSGSSRAPALLTSSFRPACGRAPSRGKRPRATTTRLLDVLSVDLGQCACTCTVLGVARIGEWVLPEDVGCCRSQPRCSSPRCWPCPLGRRRRRKRPPSASPGFPRL